MDKRFYSVLLIIFAALQVNAQITDGYETALEEFMQNNVKEAYILLKTKLQSDPEHLPSKLLMGRILLMDGLFYDAIGEFEDVLAAGADKNLVYPPLARAYLFVGQYNNIIELYRDRTITEAARYDIALVTGLAYIRTNQPEKAEQLYMQLRRKYPTDIEPINAYAAFLVAEERFNDAEQAISQATSLAPANPDTLHIEAQIASKQGKYTDALGFIRQAIKTVPDSPAYLRTYSALLAQLERYDEALEIIAMIETETPGDIQNQLLKTRILALTKQVDEADELLLKISSQLSLLTDEQLQERDHLSLITGVVAYINRNYSLASAKLGHYTKEQVPTAELLGMLANSLVMSGYQKEAIQTLESHIDTVKSNLEVGALICRLYINSDRAFKCERLLAELKEIHGSNDLVTLLTVRTLLARNEYKEAEEVLNSNISNTALPEVLELKVLLLANNQQYVQAKDLAKELVAQAPTTANQNLLVDLLLRTGAREEATHIVDQILEADMQNLPALIAKARLLSQEEPIDEALKYIQLALEIDRNNLTALVISGQLNFLSKNYQIAIDDLSRAKVLAKNDTRASELLFSIYMSTQQYDLALKEINQLLAKYRLNYDYRVAKAQLLIQLNELAEAREQLSVLYSLLTENSSRLLTLSQLQIDALDFAGAEKSLNRAIKINPNSPIAELELANFYIQQSRLAEAKAILSKPRYSNSADPNTWVLQADIEREEGNVASAFELYSRALRQDPSFKRAAIEMYELSREGSLSDKFISSIQAINESTQDPFLQHLLADTYFMVEKYAAAKDIYLQLISSEYKQNKAAIYNNLAVINLESDLEQAMEYSKQAVMLAPRSAAVIDTQGWILSLQGKHQEALDMLRKAYTLDSDDAAINYHIAATLSAMGRTNEAISQINSARLLERTSAYREKAKQLQEQLLNQTE